MNIRLSGLAVPSAALTEILNVLIPYGEHELGAELKNTGANAWAAFEVSVKFSKQGSFVVVASVAGDFSTPLWPIRRADALVTLGAGLSGKLYMNVAGAYALRLRAQSSVAPGTVEINGQSA